MRNEKKPLWRLWALATLVVPALAQAQLDIRFVHEVPSSATPGQNLVLEGEVTEGTEVDTASLHYRQAGSSKYQRAEIKLLSGGMYQAIIPGSAVGGAAMEYYAKATDFDGNNYHIFASPENPQRVVVGGGVTTPPPTPVTIPPPTPVTIPPPEPVAPPPPEPVAPPPEPVTPPPLTPVPFTPGEQVTPLAPVEPPPTLEVPGYEEPPPLEPPPEEPPPLAAPLPPLTPGQEWQPTAAPPIPPAPPRPVRDVPEGYEAVDLLTALGRDQARHVVGSGRAVVSPSGLWQEVDDAPAAITVLDRTFIRATGARDLVDILALVPGLHTSLAVDGTPRLAIRGIEGARRFLVILDGHPLRDPYSHQAFLNLPLSTIERIEVLRQPAPVLVGDGAATGVIRITTTRSEEISFWALGGGGLDGQGNGGGGVRGMGRFGSFYLGGDGDYLFQTGPSLKVPVDGLTFLGQGWTNSPGDDVTHDTWHRVNAGLQMGLSGPLMGQGDLRLSARFLQDLTGPYLGKSTVLAQDSTQAWRLMLVDLVYRFPAGRIMVGTAAIRFDYQSVEEDWQLVPPIIVEEVRELTSRSSARIQGELKADLRLAKGNVLTAGVDASYISLLGFDVRAGLVSQPLTPVDTNFPQQGAGRAMTGLFLQDAWRIVDPLYLIVGGRFQWMGDEQISSMVVLPKAGLTWHIVDWLSWDVSYSWGFASPPMADMVDQPQVRTDGSAGNPYLAPEMARTLQSGLDLTLPLGWFQLAAGFDFVFTQLRDTIDAIPQMAWPSELVNRNGIDSLGLEFETTMRFGQRSFAFLNLAWFQDTDLADPAKGVPTDTYLTLEPRFLMNVGGNWGFWYLNVFASLSLGTERDYNVRSEAEVLQAQDQYLATYFLVNLCVRTERFLDIMEFLVRFQNLANFDLRDPVPRPDLVTSNLPRAGFSLMGEARFYF